MIIPQVNKDYQLGIFAQNCAVVPLDAVTTTAGASTPLQAAFLRKSHGIPFGRASSVSLLQENLALPEPDDTRQTTPIGLLGDKDGFVYWEIFLVKIVSTQY